MSEREISRTFDVGKDAYGRPVTATRKRNYDGKIFWEIVSAPVSQRDDGERTSGLTDENIRSLFGALKVSPDAP